tara:strand:+ start:27 stop:557 length:531 start_codon:yes stop_codon:yes gene_type:complete
MNGKERDDVVFALKSTMSFYGKSVDDQQIRIWLRGFIGKDAKMVVKAFRDYCYTGKYAPKPVEILELLQLVKQHEQQYVPPKALPESSCPADVREAWSWFISKITEDAENPAMNFKINKVYTAEQEEEMLLLVNTEAHKYRSPQSIPSDYKLKEVWGADTVWMDEFELTQEEVDAL